MFTVILPTYNERENLERFVARLLEVFEANDLDGRIIVVDDGSPDGTGDRRFAGGEPGQPLGHTREEKQGIGPAYVAGFKQALATDTDTLPEMDCDFSHDRPTSRPFSRR